MINLYLRIFFSFFVICSSNRTYLQYHLLHYHIVSNYNILLQLYQYQHLFVRVHQPEGIPVHKIERFLCRILDAARLLCQRLLEELSVVSRTIVCLLHTSVFERDARTRSVARAASGNSHGISANRSNGKVCHHGFTGLPERIDNYFRHLLGYLPPHSRFLNVIETLGVFFLSELEICRVLYCSNYDL